MIKIKFNYDHENELKEFVRNIEIGYEIKKISKEYPGEHKRIYIWLTDKGKAPLENQKSGS